VSGAAGNNGGGVTSELFDAARSARGVGICVIPAATNGSKAPWPDGATWARWQSELPDDEDLARWFANGRYTGMGVVCGAVSGNVEMLEFEGRAVTEGVLDAFIAAAEACGLGDTCERIALGYQERTPSGGVHWLYRCEAVAGNVPLAKRPATPAELAVEPKAKIKILIETRGEGGFTITAPSNGTTHPTGRSWVLLTGGFDSIATITAVERAQVHKLARSFDQMPAKVPAAAKASARTASEGWEVRPGDDFNARTTWAELLDPAGWTHLHDGGDIGYWRRPGKDVGLSATTNALGTDRLKVFSTSTEFDSDRTYDRFGAYALLHHAGDLKAATKTLSRDGYGETADKHGGWKVAVTSNTEDDRDGTEGTAEYKFFNKAGLRHASLRAAVQELGPICRGPGSSLWRYQAGVWLPDGADEVRRRVVRLLGERHRRSHAEGMVADLAAEHPFIEDEQPTRWINCRNGLLDWRTGELHPHTPDVPSTYQVSVDWDPAATCPFVDEWLAAVAPEDAIELTWEIMGTAIYPDQPFHRCALLLGPGRNGKGTWLRLGQKLIGRRHYSTVTIQALAEDRFMAAKLFGKVANFVGDLDARSIGRTDLFKMATGGDPVPAQVKYGEPFEFFNRATFIFSANETPGTADHSDGFFSRWVVIPFTKLHIPYNREDPTVEPRLHAQLKGVLVKAARGLQRAMTQGSYSTVTSVTEATDQYRRAATPMLRFIDDCIEVTGAHSDTELRSTVYGRYKEWCASNTHTPYAANRFWPQLVAADGRIDEKRELSAGRGVGGIRLRSPDGRL
jgi:putative DNA primase/helicase